MGISREDETIVLKRLAIIVLVATLFWSIFFIMTSKAQEISSPTVSIGLKPIAIRQDWENQKQDKVIFSNRAPNSADNARIWVQFTDNSDTLMYIHVRHPNTGVWRKATAS